MMRRTARIAAYVLAGAGTLLVLLVAAGLVTIQTQWFRNKVRERIVYEVERATGGAVELGAFDFDWRRLNAGVRDFTIHGTEGPGVAPLFRAESIQVGIRILSLWKKQVDLQSVVVRKPRVNLIFYEDGRTNLPKPKIPRQRKRGTLETILDLAIKRFELTDGTLQADVRRMPLNAFGENLRAQIFYEPDPARYSGDISFRSLDVQPGQMKPMTVDVDTRLVVERDRLQIQRAHFAVKDSTLDVTGSVNHFASPETTLDYKGRVSVQDVAPGFRLGPFPTLGTLALSGRATISPASGYALKGQLQATGIAFRERGIHIESIGLECRLAASPERIDVTDLTVFALGGRFDGKAEIAKFRDFRVEGAVRGFALQDVTRAHVAGVHRVEWNGGVSGPVNLNFALLGGKLRTLHLKSKLEIAPMPGGNPVQGSVDLAYDHPARTVTFGPSNLVTRFSRINFDGVLGKVMNASVETTNLDDAQPAIAMFTVGPPPAMPVRMVNGVAHFRGVVEGSLKAPTIRGHASMTDFITTGRRFDRAEADVSVSRDGVVARNAIVERLRMRASGSMQVSFRDWKPDPDRVLGGRFTVRSPNLADVLNAANMTAPPGLAAGNITADVTLSGTVGSPQVSARAQAANVVFRNQPVDRVQGDVRYTETSLEIPSADIQLGRSRAQVTGRYDHPEGDWKQGRVQFHVVSRGVALAQLQAVRENVSGLEGRVETDMTGEVTVEQTGFRPGAFNGSVGIRGLGVNGEALGSLVLTAETKGRAAEVRLAGVLAGSKVTGTSTWSLEGNYPAKGHVDFAPLEFSTLLARFSSNPGTRPPFTGTVSGAFDFSGSTVDPESWRASARLASLEVQPAEKVVDVATPAGLVLRNSAPVFLDIDSRSIRVRQAHFAAKDTNLAVTGRVGLGTKNPWDLRVQGAMNLALLRDFADRVYSSGAVILDVSVRGALARPDVYGRIDLRKASLNITDFPNGIDNANGVIFLYRDRATIETLTAESGGGKLSASGFISFAEAASFHLQAKADGVRVRYPAGVSSTVDGALTFTGTIDHSLLSGDVTVTRVGFNPRSDLGTILASAAQPVSVPSQPSRFRQGMRFDVRIVTSPQVQFETKLTKDVQADASLRLRGDATRPVLLGRVMINQGEVMFFGNQYTINTGQILFVNAAKIEPTVSLDLETRARGIDVTLHVSGPVNKLNVSYRSDPPLSFSEIVALLTTGREPGLSASTTSSSSSSSQIGQNWQQAGASALVTQAIASPITGRLQRFFGVSRLKIDPQLTGLTTNNAAARLTLEQNITNNLTFTYITDLSRAQAQAIRIELDLTRNWSAVAVREENGMFGIDFLYRTQLK